MNLIIIADSYPPLNNSCAIQIQDLANKFTELGHNISIIIPGNVSKKYFHNELKIFSIKVPEIRSKSYIVRTVFEFLMPYLMIQNLKKEKYLNDTYDGIIWYSPSIFFSPLIFFLKKKYNCRSYLILRDIFPKWAFDIGLIKSKFLYNFFCYIERNQYSAADHIGVQTEGNLKYFYDNNYIKFTNISVLYNWLTPRKEMYINIEAKIDFKDKTIFIYAGNMGKAQNMISLVKLAEKYDQESKVSFLFIGRGSEVKNLKSYANMKKIKNIFFFDTIKPEELTSILNKCDVGMISLNHKHKTHNIPGKFLSYLQAGLPVLADINPNTDLERIMNENNLGSVSTINNIQDLKNKADQMINDLKTNNKVKENCKRAFFRLFSTENTAKQIIKSIIK